MAKKVVKTTGKQVGEDNTLNPPIVQETIQQNEQQSQANTGATLDDDFSEFEKRSSDFKPESEDNASEQQQKSVDVENPAKKIEREMKAKMFIGFCSYLLAGFNAFLFNRIRGTKVPTDEMLLTDTEKESIEIYFQSSEFIALLDKMPTWLIATMHIEYMFMQKHSLVADKYKVIKPVKQIKEKDKKE